MAGRSLGRQGMDGLGMATRSDQFVDLPTGHVIFRHGDEGDWAYLIERGSVELSQSTPTGDEVFIHAIGPGSLFGELALVDQQPRSATARTTAPTVLRVIQPHAFAEALARTPPLIQEVLMAIADRLRHQTSETTALKQTWVRGTRDGGPTPEAPNTKPARPSASGDPDFDEDLVRAIARVLKTP